MVYSSVGCGGTFDHLHAGHKAFLRFAFSRGKKVLIGLTTDEYVRKNKHAIASTYEIRKLQLELFLKEEGFLDRSIIVPIDSVFGPTIRQQEILDALVVTEETISGAEEINKKRQELKLSEFPVLVMPLVKKNEQKISSSDIRAGRIDQEGSLFVKEDLTDELLLLPDSLRQELQEPFGQIYTNALEALRDVVPLKTVTVGDATTVLFHKNGIYPKLAVVDFSVGRKKIYETLIEEGFLGTEEQVIVQNPAGTITPALWQAIATVMHDEDAGSRVIVIDGEEDLAVLPLVLLLPLDFVIFYGQPSQGIVKIVVSLEVKKQVKKLLHEFKRA